MTQVKGVYLLQMREFHTRNENVYKIGRSNDVFRRVKDYGNSHVYICYPCENIVHMERELIHNLKRKFNLRKDVGREHFEGNIFNIMEVFLQTIKENSKMNIDSEEELLIKTRVNIVRQFLEDTDLQIDSILLSFSNTKKTYDKFLFWKQAMDIKENVNYKYFKETLIFIKDDNTSSCQKM